VAQRTALVNALRAHLTEFGIVAPVGPAGSARLIALLRSGEAPIPDLAVEALLDLCDMIAATSAKIAAFDARLKALARQDEACQRLMKIPGVGPVAAGAIRALAGDVTRFCQRTHQRRAPTGRTHDCMRPPSKPLKNVLASEGPSTHALAIVCWRSDRFGTGGARSQCGL
jgi:transposase